LIKLGLLTEVDYLSRSVKAQMREANKLNAKYVIMIGGDEFQKGNFLLKNMKTSEQEELSLDNLEQVYTRIRG
jgi:histidyl-tRNA synthetase